jgi:ribosomal protein L11 methyltransferase
MSSDLTRQRLWQVSIATSPEGEEAVAELLSRLTGQPASSFHDFRRQTLVVSTSFPSWPRPRPTLLRHLQTGLHTIRKCGLDPAPASITVRRLPPVDWAESWKEHFPDLEIGGVLLIQPGWSRRRAGHGQIAIQIDPGLSFGTGHHPTTKFCLEELVRARPDRCRRSMLDIGTGSGLLAIAAVKLGYGPVNAFDSDPVAIRIAQENARHNRVHGSIRFRCADLRRAPELLRPHDLVCANLQADLLLEQARSVALSVRPGGRLILAGITRTERSSIHGAYAALGFAKCRGRSGGEWASLALRSAQASKT